MATSLNLIGRDPNRAVDVMPLVLGTYPLHSQSELVRMEQVVLRLLAVLGLIDVPAAPSE